MEQEGTNAMEPRGKQANEQRESRSIKENIAQGWCKMPADAQSMVFSEDPLLYPMQRDEFMSYLPPLHGASVLELGCGIGRFTGELSERAKKVTAVDFVQEYIDVCKTMLASFTNLTLVCADMLQLTLPKEKFDMVVSGYMYTNLSDSQAVLVTECVLDWLQPGGHLVFTESSTGEINAGKPIRSYNRSPLMYDHLLKGVTRDGFTLSITRCCNSRSFIMLMNATNQMHYVAQKVPVHTSPCSPSPHDCLVPRNHCFPTINDHDFKTAGVVTGSSVLVLGCGSGGLVMHLALTCRAIILGVDSDMASINDALHRQSCAPHNVARLVQFEMIALEDAEFGEGSFNVILIRDSELRTPRQYRLLPKIRRWLKPSGSFFVIDNTSYQHQPHNEDDGNETKSSGQSGAH